MRVVLCLAVLLAPAAVAEEPAAWTRANLGTLVALYRDLHKNPELSFHERETAARIAAEWKAAGVHVVTGVGGNGVVGTLKNGPGPLLMLRADLDALPITERTGLAYASKVKAETPAGEVGVMHACGHDLHMANLVGVARYLAEHKERWSGTVLLVGQPAEERGAGAMAMLLDGLFRRFGKPDFAVALHVSPELATGHVGYRAGYAMANVDSVDIVVRGKGGHGAYPHGAIDPIVQASQLVLSLQTIVSREVKPTEPAVVTVGSIRGGTKHNVIPDDCRLQLTVRSYSPEVRKQLIEAIRRKAKAVALGAGAPEPGIKVTEGTPSLFNDPKLAARLVGAFRRRLGEERVHEIDAVMGGEDFSRYGRAGVPIFMYRLGVVAPARLDAYATKGEKPPSVHSPLFYPDVEEALVTGVATMATAVFELLPPDR